jgi:hypothetical protein
MVRRGAPDFQAQLRISEMPIELQVFLECDIAEFIPAGKIGYT